MENLSELSGYTASTLVLLTFVAKDMRVLRTFAIFSNLAFITYGTIEWLPPVLFLHLVLLPLNIVRLAEILRTTEIPAAKSSRAWPISRPTRLPYGWIASTRRTGRLDTHAAACGNGYYSSGLIAPTTKTFRISR
jgi:hypothetical protein